MNWRAPVAPQRLLVGLGLFFGVIGLVLQFVLAMQAYLAAGRDVPGALGTFFAYYTILTNIGMVLAYLSAITTTPRLDLFRRPLTRATLAASVVLVTLYVHFVLSHLVTLEGLYDLADRMLHYLTPVLFVLWWIITPPRGVLRWQKLPWMLVPTLVYFALVLIRGVWVGEYPYPMLDVVGLGYAQVFLNAIFIAIGLAVLSAITIALDHLLARLSRTIPHAPLPE